MKPRTEMLWMGAKVGAAFGIFLFLAVGMTYAFYLGSFGTVTLLSAISGGPLRPTPLVIILIVTGLVFGIAFLAALCAAGGALLATVFGYAVESMRPVAALPRERVERKPVEVLQKIEADVLVDTKGQTCPLPIMNLEKAIRKLERGNVVEIHATCPHFLGELKLWCTKTSNKLLAFYIQNNLSVAKVEKT